MFVFKILRAAPGEIWGGEQTFPLDAMLEDLFDSRGYASIFEMRHFVRRWAVEAKPGSIYKTRSAAIVCCEGGAE
jgi:hypothetical protein